MGNVHRNTNSSWFELRNDFCQHQEPTATGRLLRSMLDGCFYQSEKWKLEEFGGYTEQVYVEKREKKQGDIG